MIDYLQAGGWRLAKQVEEMAAWITEQQAERTGTNGRILRGGATANKLKTLPCRRAAPGQLL